MVFSHFVRWNELELNERVDFFVRSRLDKQIYGYLLCVVFVCWHFDATEFASVFFTSKDSAGNFISDRRSVRKQLFQHFNVIQCFTGQQCIDLKKIVW